ncbi:molybdenum cofactor guanylyltransferase [Aeromicrobium duanguangcaii]|uniref:NTP transferase domain-containing protein n=1 Tax=Aeromicrobium duanguangcaii TaxID=2968086 RepID=A0ABY5KHS6_9ACTN|nr:NTP transferase domain-containing protein [Aeromicrobium duanguangcaii]MCD9153614.1 NTP transferase domain-containing protein [Aeromicrobium duanguangcaii]UUI69303.1 NTP transferase domain-containing protein [Aeromicrobium duanguangcaii]
MAPFHALLLAGGRASRLGGRDKLMVRVGGRTVLEGVVAAVPDTGRVVIVGPRRDLELDREVLWIREDPPFAGPLHAVAAGMAALQPADDDEVLILAGDLLRPDLVVDALTAGSGARVAVDPDGRRQWACSRVRAGDLARALAATDTADAPLKAVIGALDPLDVPLTAEATADLDTPDDLEEYADVER